MHKDVGEHNCHHSDVVGLSCSTSPNIESKSKMLLEAMYQHPILFSGVGNNEVGGIIIAIVIPIVVILIVLFSVIIGAVLILKYRRGKKIRIIDNTNYLIE